MVIPFEGFLPKSIAFLAELKARDSKEWFEEHRDEYESLVLNPLTALAQSLAEPLLRIDPLIDVNPKRVISKIHCDMRFSKTRYRDYAWLNFRRPPKELGAAPEFFFWLSPRDYGYGMGFYSVSNQTMERFRANLVSDPDRFRRATAFLKEHGRLAVEGESYKKPLPGEVADDIRHWYQRKRFSVICQRHLDDGLYRRELAGEARQGYELAAPLYVFLLDCCHHAGSPAL